MKTFKVLDKWVVYLREDISCYGVSLVGDRITVGHQFFKDKTARVLFRYYTVSGSLMLYCEICSDSNIYYAQYVGLDILHISRGEFESLLGKEGLKVYLRYIG